MDTRSSGIIGNLHADSVAKEATTLFPVVNIPVPVGDIKAFLKTSLNQQWQDEWSQLTHYNKLRSIKDTVIPWNSNRKIRREEVALCRLRLGHTRLTHSYIFEKNSPPMCSYCKKLNSVEHILTECTLYREARIRCSLPTMLCDILADNENQLEHLMTFLSSTKLMKKL